MLNRWWYVTYEMLFAQILSMSHALLNHWNYATSARHHHALMQLCSLHSFKTYTSSSQRQPIVGTHSRKFWRKILNWIQLEHLCLSGSVKLGGQPVLMRYVVWNRTTKVSVWSSSTLAVTNSTQVKRGVRLLLSWRHSIISKRHLWPSSGTQYWFVWTRPASFFRVHQWSSQRPSHFWNRCQYF